MQVTVKDKQVTFSGVLDEHSQVQDIINAIQSAQEEAKNEHVVFDLSKVVRANSAGIRTWIRVSRETNVRAIFINTPEWLLDQASMIPSILTEKSYVESMLLPFVCRKNEEYKTIKCLIGREVPIKKSYENYELKLEIDDKIFEIDCTSDIFSFISDDFDHYNEIFSTLKKTS